MFTFALPRFFGFAFSSGEGRPPTRNDETAHRPGRERDAISRAEAPEPVDRPTTIGGRPASQVLADLTREDLQNARNALALIYETYFGTLWHFAYRWTRSSDQAQEIVHDVFLGLWLRRSTLEIAGDVGIYLRSAVRNRIYKQGRHNAIVARLEDAVAGDRAEPPAIGRILGPDAALEHTEADRLLTSALANISPRDRDILTMRWVDRMTLDEIARELGISKSRVRTIIARASAKVLPIFEAMRDA